VPLSLGNQIWTDADKNAVQGLNENGTSGSLLRMAGTETVSGLAISRAAFTDNDGFYYFGGLLPGTYTLTLTPPAGLDLTGLNRGLDETVDSDFRQGIRQATVTLTAGNNNFDLDAGLVPTDGKVWKNQLIAEDVDDNGAITPLDALLVIIDLNANGPRVLPAPTTAFTPSPFVDVDGSGSVSPLDALLVIIKLNAQSSGSGEGEAPTAAASIGAANYLPPEFFATAGSNSTKSTEEDETSALDAFFAEVGQ
jgi:hypothetical protein